MKQYHIVETNNKQLLLLESGSNAFIPESGHFERISIEESIESVHENEILKMKCREFVGSNIKTDIIYFYSKRSMVSYSTKIFNIGTLIRKITLYRIWII